MRAQRDSLLQLAAQRRERRHRLAAMLAWHVEALQARHEREALIWQAQVRSFWTLSNRDQVCDMWRKQPLRPSSLSCQRVADSAKTIFVVKLCSLCCSRACHSLLLVVAEGKLKSACCTHDGSIRRTMPTRGGCKAFSMHGVLYALSDVSCAKLAPSRRWHAALSQAGGLSWNAMPNGDDTGPAG